MLVYYSKEATCLAVNLDCSLLVSGSEDMTVRVWHATSRQCLRTLQHKGMITRKLPTRIIYLSLLVLPGVNKLAKLCTFGYHSHGFTDARFHIFACFIRSNNQHPCNSNALSAHHREVYPRSISIAV